MSTLLVRTTLVAAIVTRPVRRVLVAMGRHWRAILLGFATGIYVAFAVCLALMMVWVAHDVRLEDYELALVMDGLLLVGIVGGGVYGYVARRRG